MRGNPLFTKGNKLAVGNKGGGRKTIKEEIEAAKESITQRALIDLANSRVYKQMIKESGVDEYDYLKTKEIALPITLKGMKDTVDVNVSVPIPLLGGITNAKRNNSARKTT